MMNRGLLLRLCFLEAVWLNIRRDFLSFIFLRCIAQASDDDEEQNELRHTVFLSTLWGGLAQLPLVMELCRRASFLASAFSMDLRRSIANA